MPENTLRDFDWLSDEIIKNDKGFIETGHDLRHHKDFKKTGKLERDPYLLETSCPVSLPYAPAP